MPQEISPSSPLSPHRAFVVQFHVGTDVKAGRATGRVEFLVRWDGRFVAGVSKVSALSRTTEVVEHREGGDPSTVCKSPG